MIPFLNALSAVLTVAEAMEVIAGLVLACRAVLCTAMRLVRDVRA